MFSTMPPALPHVRDGRLRALAVTSLRRSPAAPRLCRRSTKPRCPASRRTTWHGVVLPAGAPTAIVSKLNREIVAILHLPDRGRAPRRPGRGNAGSTPGGIWRLHQVRDGEVAKVVRESGAKAE